MFGLLDTLRKRDIFAQVCFCCQLCLCLTGDEAEQILSADVVLEPNLVVELFKKIPSEKRLNNSIGSLGDLKFVSGLNPEECHKNDYYYTFGKAFEFEEHKQAVVFMQNLAAKQNRVCNSRGTSLIEKVLVNKLEEATCRGVCKRGST